MLAAEGVVVDDVHAERCRDRWQLGVAVFVCWRNPFATF